MCGVLERGLVGKALSCRAHVHATRTENRALPWWCGAGDEKLGTISDWWLWQVSGTGTMVEFGSGTSMSMSMCACPCVLLNLAATVA